ncbi:VPS9 domain-containing protein [Mycena chlorophos]|uniref:VPS9 domain-containing protein n=1 Tax=Mycena chlorophos TaxID=658473 RepID=A0A8H6TLE6_MYCCL|nr:VPS9 domain-containing protein [Mycena chlorophos]
MVSPAISITTPTPPRNNSPFRLLYRGALSVPDSHTILDGLTFDCRVDQPSSGHSLIENKLALALESLRGVKSLRSQGMVKLQDVYLDESGGILLTIHPDATLSRVYFETRFCLEPSTSFASGVKVALGDSDGPDTTYMVIYPRLQSTDPGARIELAVARITPLPAPITRLPRPDDPTPRRPPSLLSRSTSAAARLSHKRTSSIASLGSGVRLGSPQPEPGSFRIPEVPPRAASAKGKERERPLGPVAEDEEEDVFGTASVSVVENKGKRKRSDEGQPDPRQELENQMEKANKTIIKQSAMQLIQLPKTHAEYKEVYGAVYRGVMFAVRNEMKKTAVDLKSVERHRIGLELYFLKIDRDDHLISSSMTSNREAFPAVSIGRSQGHATSELLTHTHPLLSPSSPNHSFDAKQRSPSPSRNGPHYVPYTPRQRGPPTGLSTTGMTTVAAPPQQQQQAGAASATSKLQMVNLKAAAQNVGLDGSSVGWAILEKLVVSEGGEWTEIWSALAVGKATLLLPLEAIGNNEKITADFVKDHVVLCDGPSRKNAPIITLSGLRGTLDGNTLTLRSTLHPSSKAFLDLLSPVTRSSTLANIAPLPHLPTATPYPEFGVPSYTAALPLPPRIPPPLPPRPRGSQPSSSPQSLPSRLPNINPFASLFGGSSHGPKNAQQQPPAPSPPASLHEAIHPDQPLDVPAFTIARKVVRKDVARAVDRALRAEIHACCSSPPWVAERVDSFVAPWYPFTRVKRSGGGGDKGTVNFVVGDPLGGMQPEEIGEMVQGFYAKLEDDLRNGGGRRKASEASEAELSEKEQEDKEASIREVLATVEQAICGLFFDRLFAPPSSDDPSHDQALSSRVAALNMLDLNLEHLGVDVPPEATEGLEAVVKACGQVLSRLELHQIPAEKAAVMVQAHQEVIVGLSRLPRIRLLTEEEERKRAAAKKALGSESVEEQPSTVVPLQEVVESPSAVGELEQNPLPPIPVSEDAPESVSEVPAIVEPPAEEAPPRPDLVPLPPSYTEETSGRQTPPSSIPLPTPVSSDVLLPLIIFAVVKSNPARLVSHLLYTQRFRVTPSGVAQGEEAFCLVNLMAVAEFLENVDLEALGLGNAGISTADLTPIPITRNSPKAPSISLAEEGAGVLRRQVDTIAGSAGRVLNGVTGVVDSSFGMLKQLLPGQTPLPVTPSFDSTSAAAPWNMGRPGFGLLRRETGFSIGGISLGGRSEERERREEELKEVSRPASLHGVDAPGSDVDSEGESSDQDGQGDDAQDELEVGSQYDARSIRSFESMMSRDRRKNRAPRGSGPSTRKSLTDRLAHVSANLAGLKGSPPPRRESLLPNRFDTPVSSRPGSPAVHGMGLRLPPPNQRFLECSADDLRLSEVSELLGEYRRLVDGIRAVGGFVGED